MASGFEALPPYILQKILFNGKLEALDLANLEVSSYMFRAASGIEPYRFKSITELAAHHMCQKLPLFQYMPGRARSELLAKCEGNWKLILRFLRALQQPAGCSGDDRNKVTFPFPMSSCIALHTLRSTINWTCSYTPMIIALPIKYLRLRTLLL